MASKSSSKGTQREKRAKAPAKPRIELPAPGRGPSVLAFSLPKAGSTLLYNLLTRLAPEAGLAYVSLEDQLRRQGILADASPKDLGGVFLPEGYCYGGFRSFPRYPVPILDGVQSVLLVRDPKDMLVSRYFSVAFSHRPPGGDADNAARRRFETIRERARAQSVEDYVVSVLPSMESALASYRHLAAHPRVRLFRYEDVIHAKRDWLAAICEHFGWSVARAVTDRLADEEDIFPDQDRPDEHVRQVEPGNFRKHLSADAIAEIDRRLAPYLETFGYADAAQAVVPAAAVAPAVAPVLRRVVCTGMPGSGSTWAFNVCRLALEAAGELPERCGYFGDGDVFGVWFARHGGDSFLAKLHDPGPELQRAVAAGEVVNVFTVREPMAALGSTLAQFDVGAPEGIARIEEAMGHWRRWREDGRSLILDHALIQRDPPAAIRAVLAALGLSPEEALVARIAAELSPERLTAAAEALPADQPFDPVTLLHPGFVRRDEPGPVLSDAEAAEAAERLRGWDGAPAGEPPTAEPPPEDTAVEEAAAAVAAPTSPDPVPSDAALPEATETPATEPASAEPEPIGAPTDAAPEAATAERFARQQTISWAQNFEDVILNRAFHDLQAGVYIDVGAYHPTEMSVTRLFYERGWHGVNVEPVPDLYARFAEERPRDRNLQVVVGEAPGEATFYEVPGTGFSTLDPDLAQRYRDEGFEVRERQLAVTTLGAICHEAGLTDVAFLKIDVEGAERAVLLGNDWSYCRPKVILLEAVKPHSTEECWHDWDPIVVAQGYSFVYFDGLNRFYLRDDCENLRGAFALPPGAFDAIQLGPQFDRIRALEQEQAASRQEVQVERQRGEEIRRALDMERQRTAEIRQALEALVREREAARSEEVGRRLEHGRQLAAVLEQARALVEQRFAALAEQEAALAAQRAALAADVASQDGRLSQLLQQIAAAEQSHQEKDRRLADLTRQLVLLERQSSATREALSALQAQHKAADEARRAEVRLRERVEQALSHAHEERASAISARQRSEQRQGDLAIEASQLRQRIDEAEQQLKAAQHERDALRRETVALDEGRTAFRQRAEKLEEDLAEATEGLQRLERERDELAAAANAAGRLGEEVAQLKASLEAAEAALAESREGQAALEAALTESREGHAATEAARARMEAELSDAQRTHQALIRRVDSLQADVSSRISALAEHRALLLELRPQLEDARRQLRERDVALAERHAALAELRAASGARDTLLATREAELAGLRAELAGLRVELERQTAEADVRVRTAENNLNGLGAEYAKLQQRYESFRAKPMIRAVRSLYKARRKVIDGTKPLRRTFRWASPRWWLKRLAPDRLGIYHQHEAKPLVMPGHYGKPKRLQAEPRISVVTPNYNTGAFLEETIRSVVEQGYGNLQYIVQDGASTDNSVEIIRRWEDKLAYWASEKDRGQSDAINRGFQHADGDILAYLNSDDLLLPGCLNYVAWYFETHPDVDAIYGHRIIVDENTREVGRWFLPPHDPTAVKYADYIPQETLFWRRRVWEKIERRVDDSFRFAMDWDLILRLQEAGSRFVCVPRFLGAFRVHSAQKSQAVIHEVGHLEMGRLRERALGRPITHAEALRETRSYRQRSRRVELGWRLGLKRL